MSSKDKCLELAIIPQQFGLVCWFNAILTVSIYSEGVRKYLLKEAEKWDKKNGFLMIIKVLLIYYKYPNKIKKFFSKINTYSILLKMLKIYNDKFLIDRLKLQVKYNDLAYIGYHHKYIINLFKYMKVNCLDITYIDKKYYLNIQNQYFIHYDKENKKEYNNFQKSFITKDLETFKEILSLNKKSLKMIPNIIFLTHEDLHNHFKTNIFPKINNPNKTNIDLYDSKHYNFNIKNIDTYDEIIELNGYKYKLDACLLTNYNVKNFIINHEIAGITCNNNHYIYNGIITDDKYNDCPLIKYDWNLKQNNEFCFHDKLCNTKKVNTYDEKNDHCFSFAKSNRLIVYTRISDLKEKSESKLLSLPKNINIKNNFEMIEELANIKNLSNYELKIKLGEYYHYSAIYSFFIFMNKSRKELEELYLNFLKYNYYGYAEKIKLSPISKDKNKILKKDLIQLVLYKYPDMKNIKNKTKKELIRLLD